MIRVMKSEYPPTRAQWKPNNITLGEMKSYWKRAGNFNTSLYARLSDSRSN